MIESLLVEMCKHLSIAKSKWESETSKYPPYIRSTERLLVVVSEHKRRQF